MTFGDNLFEKSKQESKKEFYDYDDDLSNLAERINDIDKALGDCEIESLIRNRVILNIEEFIKNENDQPVNEKICKINLETVAEVVEGILKGKDKINVLNSSCYIKKKLASEDVRRLKTIGVELGLASLMSGREAFNRFMRIEDEEKGEFELDDALKVKDKTSGERREMMKRFWQQMKLITQIIRRVENSREGMSYKELVNQILGSSESKKLSQEQKFRIKREIFNVVATEKRINQLCEEDTDLKKMVALFIGGDIDDTDLKGEIEMDRSRFYLAFYLSNSDDYNLVDKILGGKSSGRKKVYLRGIPVIFVKGGKSENVDSVSTHEKRHVKNDFLMPDEDNGETWGAKDEILAYLNDGTPLIEIENTLIDSKGEYTYELDINGEAWERHCTEVKGHIDILIDIYQNNEYINLDILAMFPLRHWRHLKRYMGIFVENKKDPAVVRLKLYN